MSITIILALTVASLFASYHFHREKATNAARNLAVLLSSIVGDTLDRADGDERIFVRRMDRVDLGAPIPVQTRFRVHMLLRDHLDGFPAARGYAIVDAEGRVVFSAVKAGYRGTAPTASANAEAPAACIDADPVSAVGGRPWFRVLRDDPGRDLIIERSVDDLAGGKGGVMILALPIRDAGGGFRGAVVGCIDLAFLDALVKTPTLGEDGMVAVRRADTFAPFFDSAGDRAGGDLAASPIRQAVTGGAVAGEGGYRDPVTGRDRVYGFQTLAAYRLSVIVSRWSDAYLEEWRIQLVFSVFVILPILVLILVLATRQGAVHQRLVAESLRANALVRQLEIILDNASVGIVFVKDRRPVWFNDTIVALYGYAREDLTGRGLEALFPTADLYDAFSADAYRGLTHGRRFARDIRMRRQDGAEIWVQVSGQAVDPAHIKDGTIWVVEDISERKQVEETLREAKERFEIAASAGVVGVWDWRVAERIFVCDDLMHTLFDTTREDIGTDIDEWFGRIHPDDRGRIQAAFRAAIETGKAFDPEFRVVRVDGTFRHVKAASRVVMDAFGRAVRVVGVAYDVTERADVAHTLEVLANTDPLTGLPNRRAFDVALDTAFVTSKSGRGIVAILMIDIDHFKVINDTHGHAAGDAALTALAQVLRATPRAGDLAARIGGEEFAVLLVGAGLSGAIQFADRLRRQVAALRVACPDAADRGGEGLRMTISVGVTVMAPADRDWRAALSRADQALYDAKGAGRNTVRALVVDRPWG